MKKHTDSGLQQSTESSEIDNKAAIEVIIRINRAEKIKANTLDLPNLELTHLPWNK